MKAMKKTIALVLAAIMMLSCVPASAAAPASVKEVSITGATVTVPEVTYDGKEHTPEVTVVLNGKTLVKDVDYKVYTLSHTNSGSYLVKVVGIGNYSGTIEERLFTIKPVPVTEREELKASKVIKTSGKTSVKNNKKHVVKVNLKKTKGKVTLKILKQPKKAKAGTITYKNGKIVIKKGAKKGVYKVKVIVGAYNEYKQVTKTIKIVVK